MNKKIASEIAVGVVLLIAIVVGGIFWMQNKKEEVPAIQTAAIQLTVPVVQKEEQQQVQQSQLATKIDEKVYINNEYGFQLVIPNSWDGYRVEKKIFDKKNPFDGEGKITGVISFDFRIPVKGVEGLDSASLLRIILLPKDEIALCSEVVMCPSGAEIAKNDKYSFGVEYGTAGSGYVASDFHQQRLNEVGDVIKTFKLTDVVSNETANWQTYNDDKYGFSIEYPSEFLIEKNGVNKNLTGVDDAISFGNSVTEDNGGQKISYVRGVTLLIDSRKTEIASSLEERKKSLNDGIKVDDIKIDGIPAVKIQYRDSALQSYADEFYFLKNGKAFSLLFEFDSKGPKSYEDNMIATLKFTK